VFSVRLCDILAVEEVDEMTRGKWSLYDVSPSAARLTSSLRDIGYDFPTAVADVIDNSLAADASQVRVDIEFHGPDSFVSIGDDGRGMSPNELLEALRLGSRRDYLRGDLGRFGLGLKTASLSQCRRVTVVTRRSPERRMITTRTLDLDIVEEHDRWLVVEDEPSEAVQRAQARLAEGPGTIVVWENLDRVIPERQIQSGWGKRRLASVSRLTSEHLGMVFHRFLDGLLDGRHLVLTVNGEKVESWDPFASHEEATTELPLQTFEIETGISTGEVRLRRFVLPSKDRFSTVEEFERLSGPLKWNRQQGIYVYRADRLVQFGGWNAIRAIDEHTKLARAALDFETDLDETFQINVAKMRIILPAALRPILEPPIHELCIRAGDVYRRTSPKSASAGNKDRRSAEFVDVGVALRAAALEAGQFGALTETFNILKQRSPELWKALGLDN
jgi:hypothetical protein